MSWVNRYIPNASCVRCDGGGTVVVQRSGEQQDGAGESGRSRDGEGRAEQREFTDVAEEVRAAPLHGQQRLQHLPIIQHCGGLKHNINMFIS